MNLVTASGHVYSFLLIEISKADQFRLRKRRLHHPENRGQLVLARIGEHHDLQGLMCGVAVIQLAPSGKLKN